MYNLFSLIEHSFFVFNLKVIPVSTLRTVSVFGIKKLGPNYTHPSAGVYIITLTLPSPTKYCIAPKFAYSIHKMPFFKSCNLTSESLPKSKDERCRWRKFDVIDAYILFIKVLKYLYRHISFVCMHNIVCMWGVFVCTVVYIVYLRCTLA